MTSSVFTDWGDWHVRNLMFWRIFDLATEVGEKRAGTDEQRAWVCTLQKLLTNQDDGAALQSSSPDVDIFEIVNSQKEAGFWSDVLFDVAGRVFQGEFGATEELRVKTETVWAAYDLAVLLRMVPDRPRQINKEC